MSTQAGVVLPQVARPSRIKSLTKGFLRFARRNPLGAMGLLMIVTVAVLALNRFIPIFQRYDPVATDYSQILKGPSLAHWMGTDEYGRDLWSRLIGGTWTSFEISVSAVTLGSGFGLLVGVTAGYIGGVTDDLTQRWVEVMQSMPSLLLALAMMSTLGPGIDKVIISISVAFFPRATRTMRGTVLSVKENVYIEAARAIGASNQRIMFRHIVPNVMAPFLIVASAALGTAILSESTLSFLGLGVPPPYPSWGRMLANSAGNYAISAPWIVIFPGLAITWMVLGFNLFGDALRDVWDPRLRGSQ